MWQMFSASGAAFRRNSRRTRICWCTATPEVPADRIFAEVLRIRPQAWPNLRMLEFGDAMLDRRGELLAAAAGVYRTQLDRGQYLPEQMRSGGRGREIIAALSQGG